MSSPFRIYATEELGPDGYPRVWHRNNYSLNNLLARESAREVAIKGHSTLTTGSGVKDIVRSQADHRCIRCQHPFIVGVSGVMEGPHAEAKGLAAELGVSVEMLDQAMALAGVRESLTPEQEAKSLERAPRTNWSPCDSYCTHRGPARYRPGWNEHGEGVGEQSDIDPWSAGTATPPEATAGELVADGIDVEAAWRILTVHHLNEVKADLRWWNLCALCQRCHLLIQRKVRMDRPWPWEHTPWFRPYAAGFYAAKYLSEDLNRDETMARLDDLLELGRREESVERMPI